MKSSLVETLVGAAVIAVAALFVFYGYTVTGQASASGGYRLVAGFDRVDGLPNGGDVRMSGIKVGTVVGQKLDQETYIAVVTMVIDETIKLPADTSAKITSDGLLGSNYIALTPGGAEEMLEDGDEITFTQGSIDLIGLVGQAMFSASDSEGP